MDQNGKLLIDTLARSVAGRKYGLPESVNWEQLEKLGLDHSVCALVYDGLKKEPEIWKQVPEAVRNGLYKAFVQAIYWDTQRESIFESLRQKLILAEVPHVFLKGIRMRQYYPEPALRTMCDIDVLVYTRDYEKIHQISLELGGEACYGDGNHKTYRFRNGVTVEFHPNLMHQAAFLGAGLNPGWQYVKPDGENSTMELTPEGFYLNVLCHMGNHLVYGGIGIRFVLDIWVCRNRMTEQLDRGFVEGELERFGMLELALNIEKLAECWFGSGELTPELEELGEYIFTSGSYGNTEREILNAVSRTSGGSSVAALWRRVFYPRKELEDRFPWCAGKPWLLPVAWLVRVWGVVTRRRHLILRWGRGVNAVNREQIQAQREKLRRFGIKLPEK